jgi:ribosomal protein L22
MLSSAVANALNNDNQKINDLFIDTLIINK